MPIPPKTVVNADTGTADLVGGNDWDDLVTHLANMNKEPYTWYVYKDGSTFKAKNGNTGVITYSNTDFKIVFQAIADTIPTRDDTVFTKIRIGPGTFDVNSAISIDNKYNIDIEGSGMGVTRLQAGPTLGDLGGSPFIGFSGNISGTSKSLTANGTVKSKTITMSSGDASTFAAGDLILLRATNTFDADGAAKVGEIKRIFSISSGTITFETPLYNSYTTANAASMIKLLPTRNISISNLTIGRHASYNPDIGLNHQWLRIAHGERIKFTNIEVVDFPGQFSGCLSFRSCIEVKVSGCHLQQNIPYNWQYGIAFIGCCQDCVVSNCTSIGDWRHPYECGDGSTSTNFEGQTRNILFVNCTAQGGTQAQFDSHPDGEFMSYIGCGVIGTNTGAAFKHRAPKSSIINCFAITGNQYLGVQPEEAAIKLADEAKDCIIAGNHIINGLGDGIRVDDGLDNIVIRDNNIQGCSVFGIRFESGSSKSTIMGNTIKNCGDDGISLLNWDNGMICNNMIDTNGGYGIDFEAATCTNNMVVANYFTGNTSGTVNNGAQTGNVEASNKNYT